MKDYIKQAELLSKHFAVYGYGNFDLTNSDVANILSLLESGDAEGLTALYEQLYKTRMG